MKPEFRHIIIVLDDVYHELVYSDDREFFLDVVDYEEFKSRVCVILSFSKVLAGNPGLRFGILYAPNMEIDGKIENIGTKFGVLMADSSTAVCNANQYVGEKIIHAKVGKGNPEWIKIQKEWETNCQKVYNSVVKLGISLFNDDTHFPLVVKPYGAFFGLISGRKLLGKKVPETIKLQDGRTVSDLPKKIQTSIFQTDVQIAYFLLYAAEVVTVPASGFFIEPEAGYLRISFAISEDNLKEAFQRLNSTADEVLKSQ